MSCAERRWDLGSILAYLNDTGAALVTAASEDVPSARGGLPGEESVRACALPVLGLVYDSHVICVVHILLTHLAVIHKFSLLVSTTILITVFTNLSLWI